MIGVGKSQKVEQALELIKEGVERIKSAEGWKEWLQFQSMFHSYSFNNTLLILAQRPNATRVAGYKAWKKLGRQVQKGESGIRILAPQIRTFTEEDEATGEDVTVKKCVGFYPVYVFDVSQTTGQPLPASPVDVSTLDESNRGVELHPYIQEAIDIPVSFEPIEGQANGYYQPKDERIVIDDDLSMDHQCKTMIHEYAHHRLPATSYSKGEVEAESVAFIVAYHYGLDTSEYSFGYVANWAANEDIDVGDVGAIIQPTAHAIIDRIDGVMESLAVTDDSEPGPPTVGSDAEVAS